ncbi:hypothetical protein FSARC_13066 [Fusarium sarcochroum]|uniref:Helicase C-terminal domain-containing protein n=1 Tax=Fusarium sarcochroum TaxID=1208366 RepID=A0A8H4T419_9HYPO|nr:hypothetical protein FSARC_13066 [Fusarium sarcochroum]
MSINWNMIPYKRTREISEGTSQTNDGLVLYNDSYASSQSPSSTLIICYGALNDAAAQYLDSAITPDDTELTNCKNFYRFPIREEGKDFVLQNSGNETFCVLDLRSISRLTALNGLQSIQLEALAATNDLSKRRKNIKKRQTFSVSINIFGPQDVASEVASRLSRVSAFLQHPKSLEPEIVHSNSQYFRLPDVNENMSDYVGVGNTMPSTAYGGIIADVMGLEEHEMFYQGEHSMNVDETLTGATLVVVTSVHRDGLDVLGQMNWYRIVPLDQKPSFETVSRCIQSHNQSKMVHDRNPYPKQTGGTGITGIIPPAPSVSLEINISQQHPGTIIRRRAELCQTTPHEIDEVVSGTSNIKKYNILFTTILKMRMLCNKGTLPASGPSTYLSPQKPSAKCERCSEINEDDALLLESFSFCPDCDRPLHLSSPHPELRLSPMPDYNMENEMIPQQASSVGPHSTKLSAVVNQVYRHGIGAKHIGFSYWTSTLDALGQLFNLAGIPLVQIDGRTSYTERSNRLNKFRQDSRVIVLLMSIETGAVGATVEEQAVARALRMGQTKEVKIFRYIMKNTVEEVHNLQPQTPEKADTQQNIISLQKKKKKLATFTFDGDDEGVQEKLKASETVVI